MLPVLPFSLSSWARCPVASVRMVLPLVVASFFQAFREYAFQIIVYFVHDFFSVYFSDTVFLWGWINCEPSGSQIMVIEKGDLFTPPSDSLPINAKANEVADIQDLAVYRSSTPFAYNLNVFAYTHCNALLWILSHIHSGQFTIKRKHI